MQRNLLRCVTWMLPSGQRIANEMGIPPLGNSELAELQVIRPGFVQSTPLFYYILKEAQLREDGLRLGPVGARIVTEVFVGLLQLDPDSYLKRPTKLGANAAHTRRNTGKFPHHRLPDLRRRGSHQPRAVSGTTRTPESLLE